MTTSPYRIKSFGVLSISKFFAVIGLVWGFLAGVILLASYVQGYMTKGDLSLIQSGILGLCLMVVYGVIGGLAGGAIIACVYNKVLGARNGIRMELDAER
jgi:hypothetical protein